MNRRTGVTSSWMFRVGLIGLLTGCGGSVPSAPLTGTPIASRYSGDEGIENDPDVLFTEMGEEATLAELFARWSASSSSNSVALDATTFVPGSPGRQSIRLFTTAGPLGPGTIRSAMLYKHFPVGLDGTVFLRWYVKYNSVGTLHHSGPRLGGNNPLSPTSPNSPAGIKPTGADFFYLGAETSQGKTVPVSRSNFDFYNYWMHQRGTTFFPGLFYGNSFINSNAASIDMNTWTCVEVQLTLNEPVSAFNGEIAMWINGLEVARVKQGTLGSFTEDDFAADDFAAGSAGTPFEGFQWRNDPALKFNYLQLLHFVDNDPTGFVNAVNYDHIVLARRYIGPVK